MTFIRSEIVGYGHYLPAKVLTNDDLSKMVETNDEWIRERTGIRSRHIVTDELTSDMAAEASKKALERAGIKPEELDVIILGTLTPDNTAPSTSCRVASKIGAKPGTPAFDVVAACSGFVYAMTMADNMIRLGQAKTALVIGVESMSKVVDWTDRNTCVLFGDGGGAVVLRATEGKGTVEDTGILATKIYADGSHYDDLLVDGGVSATQTTGHIFMNGKEVFRNAIPDLADAAEDVMKMAGVTIDDIDWLVPHQANIRIIEGVGKKLGIPEEKVIVTVDHHANTSAATIPLALSESLESGKIKKGDLIVLNAMGAGFTWGGALIRI
jgi:3-oxoacyl-[acyl-carrier-protein] synthase-3